MILDLKELFVNENGSLPIKYELDLRSLEFAGGYPLKKPVEISGAVENRAGVVTLKLACRAEYDAPCDRCGEPATESVPIEIDRVVVQSLSGEDTGEYLIAENGVLDIDETVTSEVVLGVPSKHLCSKSCRGRCQKCGKNLNEGQCSCNHTEIDPRLAVLADLLD